MREASRLARFLQHVKEQPRLVLIPALAVLVFLLGCALSFGPLVRVRVQQIAARRGLDVQVTGVRPAWRGTWLLGLDVTAAKMPGVRVHLDAVKARLSWDLSLSSVELHGARVSLEGSPDSLLEQWRAFGQRTSESTQKAGADVDADGVDLAWLEPASEPRAVHAWGIRYSRHAQREECAADLLRLNRSRLVLELRGVRVQTAAGKLRSVESLAMEGAELDMSFTRPPPSGRALAQDTRAPDPHTRTADVLAARELLADLVRRAVPVRRPWTIHGVVLHLRHGNEMLNLGPSELTLERDETALSVALASPVEAGSTPLELRATLPLDPGDMRIELRGGPVSLASLGVREGDFGLIGVKRARLEVSGEIGLSADAERVSFSGNGVAEEVSLARAELAPQPISGIRLAFHGRGGVALDGSELRVDEGDFSLGEVHVQATGSLERRGGAVTAHLKTALPLASCQALLDAVPRGLAPLIASMHMTGTLTGSGLLDYDSAHPSATRVRLEVNNDCRIDRMAAEISPHRFAGVFQREVRGADRLPMRIESGPGSETWVPYEDISPFMETAVLVCEDGHFPRHRGFDYEAIGNAIRDNLIAGRFARGASTISMQLAKNLYLDREKTLARKIQEAALTLLLEQELDKRTLMELYLNVIEYGPGIYGIGPAADYYFAKKPRDLSLGQALYIASILPNPDRQHFLPDGRVSEFWGKYLQRLMGIAKKIKRITDEQLDAGLKEQIAFRVADSGAPPPAGAESDDESSAVPEVP